ncbi:peptide deformylase [Staphylococcus devriesei]|uniref:Peptide deformylase-like n=1 Tax=Staphylococcus devriesei TaxID=586733 RepID=A0A2K4DHY4_9STAP|nr:peptide deformylase [Staphylococcus devriesei]MCE5089487.1 peptide deformylase [Staphylococcus devriesei]MCE5096264.1 peptide deformylase [Staphylococcus devriesei]PNZ86456.1 peptide deformylase [Staphylococcus devriesei]PTE74402.1 peptide deformylase [Staphylococcus devriesei]PTF04548.1 peptide deformylase [Staphylococcus devriesei]
MAIQKLVQSTHPVLTKQAQPVTQFDATLKDLLLDIEDTLYAEEASALSAPQIGISKQVAMIDMELEGLLQLINPKVKSESDEKILDLEGSVNLPGVFGEVERSKMIVVEGNDLEGNTIELTAYDDVARMLLHIIDQLNGIVFTERAKRILTDEEMEAYFDNE